MAFEPRILRPEDDSARGDAREAGSAPDAGRCDADHCSEDQWLPAELQELASQLSADADYLEACHPLEQPSEPQQHAPLRRWLPRMAAAAVLVAVGFSAIALRDRTKQSRTPIAPVAAVEQLAQDIAVSGKPAKNDGPLVQAAVSPAIWLENLTGSEREGVLDLLEQQAIEPGSLSI